MAVTLLEEAVSVDQLYWAPVGQRNTRDTAGPLRAPVEANLAPGGVLDLQLPR